MFTGIVQGTGRVAQVRSGAAVTRLVLDFGAVSVDKLALGASVAVSGVCLTVVAIEGTLIAFDVIPETLERTHLGALTAEMKVNLERSLKMGDELGGHLLSGHIMGCGVVRNRTLIGADEALEGLDLEIAAPRELMKFIQSKGYIAIDGISLTIGAVTEDSFTLHLIPETLRLTTIGERLEGASVNLEIDSMTQTIVNTTERTVARLLNGHEPS